MCRPDVFSSTIAIGRTPKRCVVPNRGRPSRFSKKTAESPRTDFRGAAFGAAHHASGSARAGAKQPIVLTTDVTEISGSVADRRVGFRLNFIVQLQTTTNRTVVERPAETLMLRSGSPSTRHLPGRLFRRTTWLPAGVSSAVKTPTSPLTEPSTPAGSMETVNVIVSTPGPRLVTPTVTRPDTRGDSGATLAQAAPQKKRDAETQRRTAAAVCIAST
jgi:hypothetical protein